MTTVGRQPTMLGKAHSLLLHHFRHAPFHNLDLLYNNGAPLGLPGGTCSDKSLSFLADARQANLDAHLHSARIGGQEVHRLVRLRIHGETYFADVGNGWPAVRLFPAGRAINYHCFGMRYRTEVTRGHVRVFHERNGRESLQTEIDVHQRPEGDILADIRNRYTSGINYPFSSSVRFSALVGSRFLFLRGPRLEIYTAQGVELVDGIAQSSIPDILADYFHFPVSRRLRDTIAGHTP